MHNRRIYIIAGIAAVVIVVGFVLSVPQLRDASAPTNAVAETASTPPVVYLRDVYKKGTHSITGEVAVSDPCVDVVPTVSLVPAASSSSVPTILVALDMPPDTGICLEEPATTTFSVSAAAPANATIAASINGTNASTTSY